MAKILSTVTAGDGLTFDYGRNDYSFCDQQQRYLLNQQGLRPGDRRDVLTGDDINEVALVVHQSRQGRGPEYEVRVSTIDGTEYHFVADRMEVRRGIGSAPRRTPREALEAQLDRMADECDDLRMVLRTILVEANDVNLTRMADKMLGGDWDG